ncbi:unnamed protein product [Rhizopus stolonifer]
MCVEMIQEMDSFSQESLTLVDISKPKANSESDKDLYLFSLNESLQIHKEMVERVQSEKDNAQEALELALHEQALVLDQERQTILDQQLSQQQHRQQLEQARDKLLEDLEQRQEEYAQNGK